MSVDLGTGMRTFSDADLATLISTGQLTRRSGGPRRAEAQRCVEFIDGGIAYWSLLPDGPIPQTWEEAEVITKDTSVCLDPHPPRNWEIVASFERDPLPKRVIKLTHYQKGTSYVPITDGSAIPQSLDQLITAVGGKPQRRLFVRRGQQVVGVLEVNRG